MKNDHDTDGQAKHRLYWFILLWVAGVVSLGAASLVIRFVMKAAGLGT